ncbi:MAG: hypothetical protein ABIH76_07185 [Candidatus Bathyarchaeota archaeon]
MLESKTISSTLISSGYPEGWNSSNYQRIGLTDSQHRINETKLGAFMDLMSYEDVRVSFKTANRFYFYLEYPNGTIVDLPGNNTKGIVPSDHDHLVSVRRIVIYNSKIVSMVLQLWD